MAEEKNFRFKALQLRGLRQRWIFNTVMPVFALVLLIVVLFSSGVSGYYYGTMQKGLETRAQAMANSFNEYFMDNGYMGFYPKAVQAADSFEDKNSIELQFISSSGRIQVSTSGLTAGTEYGFIIDNLYAPGATATITVNGTAGTKVTNDNGVVNTALSAYRGSSHYPQ